MSSSNHPLPPPPGGQTRPHQHERTKSSFSFKSNHSHKSSGSFGKIDLHETHEEKEARRLHTKADPTIAIMEAEPAVIQANEKSLLGSLRAVQHKDSQGNPIVEPDRSNPTRSRWERPLDTIRSFEAAIDGNYRKTYSRADSESAWNRRGSYYAGGANDERPRNSQNGYYGNRSQSYRDSYYNGNGNANGRPDSYYYNNGQEQNGNGNGNGYQNQNRSRYPRTTSEPYGNGQGVYPVTGNQQSYETVTTASGSGSSGEPAGYTTDPSSENSSLDRGQPIQNRQPADNYGFDGFGANPQLQPVGAGINNTSDPYNNNNRSRPQNQGSSVLRKQAPGGPIKLGGTANGNGPSVYEPPRPEPEKRKSFFKRFSRSS